MSGRGLAISFDLTAGEAFRLAFDTDGPITGATARFWCSRRAGGTVVLTTEGSAPTALAQITSATQFQISVEDEATELLKGSYVYECELEDQSGNKRKACHGVLTFAPQVEV